MPHFVVYETANGALVSQGAEAMDPAEMSENWTEKQFAVAPVAKLWNPSTLEFDIDQGAWYAVYDPADGNKLKSSGSSVNTNVIATLGWGVKGFAERPPNLWNPVTLEFDVAPPASVKSWETSAQFMLEFTFDEHAAILTAAKTVPGIEVFMDRLRPAKGIRSDDPNVAAGLAYCVGLELIEAHRPAEILSDG